MFIKYQTKNRRSENYSAPERTDYKVSISVTNSLQPSKKE